MSLNRVLRIAGLACVVFGAVAAQAAAFGNKPVRLIVPFAAGGATDIVARSVADQLSKELEQVVVVENKPGVGGALGANYVSKAEPDGHTLGVATVSTMAANPAMNPANPYDPIKGFTPIITIAMVPVVLVVNPARIPVENLRGLVAFLQARPGKHSFASAGTGGVGHLDGELFKALTRTDIIHVAYKGAAPAITDLLAGQVDMMFDNLPSMLPHIQSGKLKAMAIMSPQRTPNLPDVPTFTQAGWKTLDNTAWMGLVAPPKLPAASQEALRKAFARALDDPAVRKRFADSGIQPVGGTSAEFATRIRNELALRKKIVADQKLKLE